MTRFSWHCTVVYARLTLLVWHPAAKVLLQVCVLVVVDAHKGVPRLRGQVRDQAGLAAAGGALQACSHTK
jgi:hypothetical protein